MSYDSDASFDTASPDSPSDSPDAAPAPDSASSAALIAGAAVAMAAASAEDDFRTDSGWDSPPSALMSTRHSVASSSGWYETDMIEPGAKRRQSVIDRGVSIRMAAERAYSLHPDHCERCTAEVAHSQGHGDLDGLSANAQVARMRSRWREVDAARARSLANDGKLVIAGRAGDGKSGHTTIVMYSKTGRPWPFVYGGGPPTRRSDGSRTLADIWTAEERAEVRYFTPETRSWLRRAFASLLS